eukprot:CAMPEP_0206243766 /NCGR_PEP_ID=MMETSP0047_2-20121206/17784_1 /ASSEMBLY_ACC=CAM_ASM_000192 /TAXON_ID=195065 /ORGANISM="Chroomonas mesostigmatica_cf, Strain CCMP1168" /LENGTH=266 /DNA_ID=CAMNT_0053668911 /DNA_START=42 /DNA_END=839 /DNA_ORIENTATION=+
MKWRVAQASFRLIKVDKERYDMLWERLLEDDTNDGTIEHLSKVVRMLGLNFDVKHKGYQFNRRKAPRRVGVAKSETDSARQLDAMEVMFGVETMPGSVSQTNVCNSLDQLYAQALIANFVSTDKVKQWASSARGRVPVENAALRPGSPMWASHVNRGADLRKLPLKKPRRAMEKLLRSYDNKPSHLVDLCRHAIVFNSLSDLTMCLGQIVTDSEIQVVRIKNRLSTSYNAAITAGYRDVAINFKVVLPVTCALGAESHVCELQLVL